MRPTRLHYCQYLLVSQTNYTLTNYADHHDTFSHDALNRYLRRDKLTSALVWDNVRAQVKMSERGYIAFDDTVLDKNHSHHMGLVQRQYSGNAHGLIKGIGVVNCVYVNPESGQFWLLDYRVFHPESDGKTKLDHVQEMLIALIANKQLAFRTVLMDTWYATKSLMLLIESLHKIYYCPLKANRLVDDSNATAPYRAVSDLVWSQADLEGGKVVKINAFPKLHKVKLFRVVVSSHRTDFVVTNDMTQQSTKDTQEVCALRWKIEQFHRQLKQTTGIEACQCRCARIQRNHIACAMLVWVRLTEIARTTGQTIYRIKNGMLDEYLRQQLKNPFHRMSFA
jgi:hypothetical protein